MGYARHILAVFSFFVGITVLAENSEFVLQPNSEAYDEKEYKKIGRIDTNHTIYPKEYSVVKVIGEREINGVKFKVIQMGSKHLLIKAKSLKPRKLDDTSKIKASGMPDTAPAQSTVATDPKQPLENYLVAREDSILYSEPGWDNRRYNLYDELDDIKRRDMLLGESLPAKLSEPGENTKLYKIDETEIDGNRYFKVEYSSGIWPFKFKQQGWISEIHIAKEVGCCNDPGPINKLASTLANIGGGPKPKSTSTSTTGEVPLPKHFPDNCEAFIKRDGTYGAVGEKLKSEILGSNSKAEGHSDDFKNQFLNPPFQDFASLCPNFSKMNEAKKINYWIWIFTELAFDESTCYSDNVNPNASNDKAGGYFQLPESWTHRSWRGKGCNMQAPRVAGYVYDGSKKVRSSGQMLTTNPDNNIPCAVQIMGNIMNGMHGPANLLLGKNSYWNNLKNNVRSTRNHINSFPPCRGAL